MDTISRQYKFEISLSVLNHLGRKLYRNFITILSEAISNSWDADAENVWIYIDREKNNLVIKDDGIGMDGDDFQEKFLRVGYSKRKNGQTISKKGRPFIGAKGIGKLALLSCAEKIHVVSKKQGGEYIGGQIVNSDLDEAIMNDITPDKYSLEIFDLNKFDKYTQEHDSGTILFFEELLENIKISIPYLKKLITLYFKFSVIDNDFNIYINDDPVSFEDLKNLSDSTEFLWIINKIEDPFLETLNSLKNAPISITNNDIEIKGFVASVEKPSALKIIGTEEKAGIDLFVNGRLRERNILKHMPDFSTRHVASYLYGQIHFDKLDEDNVDRFTSNRESVISGDPLYEELLTYLQDDTFEKISNQWDDLRLSRGEDGDDENPRKTKKERRARSLYNISSKDYTEKDNSKVNKWIEELQPDAEFNIPSYVDCYLSENLIRKYITENGISLTGPAENEINSWRAREEQRKSEANISFGIREHDDPLSYLGIDFLAKVIEGNSNQQNTASLIRDGIEYRPMRNAIGHTALLTRMAKDRLNLVYQNIKSRLKTLLSSNNSEDSSE